LGPNHTVVIGAETEKEKLDSFSYLGDYSTWPNVTYTAFSYKEDATNNALFLQDQFSFKAISAAIGVRYDDHSQFGSKTTWRFAPTYNITSTKTRLKGSIGTGFKAPSLYQLYGQLPPYNVGNENLKPEESLSWDLGIEQSLFSSSFIISLAYFHNDIDDYIDYDYSDGYVNVKGLTTQGIESTIEWYPSDRFDIRGTYTYTDSKTKEDGSRLLRRPLHKGSFDLNLYPLDAVKLSLSAVYVGKRDDTGSRILDAYTVVNLATSYQVTNNFKVFGRVNNLFDKDYEEVSGYGTAGLSGYAGVKLSF